VAPLAAALGEDHEQKQAFPLSFRDREKIRTEMSRKYFGTGRISHRAEKAEVGSRITEASSLPALRIVFDERFRYYNQERRHSSIGYIPPREHLGQTLDTLESEPQIAAAS